MRNRAKWQGLVVAALLLAGCDNVLPLNSASPSYVKNVAAYKEGSDGLAIYVVLADQQGQMTTADGMLELTVSETKSEMD